MLTLYPAYGETASVHAATASELQRALGERDALVAFTVTPYARFAVVARQTRIEVIDLQTSPEDVATLTRGLIASMAARGRGAVPSGRATRVPSWQLASQLYTRVWAPLESAVGDATVVHLMATGSLASVPFQVLLAKPLGRGPSSDDFRSAEWLVRRHAFDVLTSADSGLPFEGVDAGR